MKIGNYNLGNTEKTTRRVWKHADAANIPMQADPDDTELGRIAKLNFIEDDEVKPQQIQIVKEDDGIGTIQL